jgi:hypothetical protein
MSEKILIGPLAKSKPETINYRTFRSQSGTVFFCAKIFGYQGLRMPVQSTSARKP